MSARREPEFEAILPWWDDTAKVMDLVRWMEDNGEFDTVSDAIDVVEEPWHYHDEWEQMVAERRNEESEAA